MSHMRTSTHYPQSNGKIERGHQSLKRECLRPRCPLSLKEARSVVGQFVAHYNFRRLHSAIGYVTPADKLAGRERRIFAMRDRRLQAAREQRRLRRRQNVKEPFAQGEGIYPLAAVGCHRALGA